MGPWPEREAEIEPIKQTATPHRENQMIDSYIEGSGQGKNPFLKMSTLSKFKVNDEEKKNSILVLFNSNLLEWKSVIIMKQNEFKTHLASQNS